jgi:hypothetical protein
MESIPSTIPNETFRTAHTAPLNRLQLLFEAPSLRSPVLEEMQDDLDRLIAKVARQSSDASCPELNFDELEGEGRFKLAYVISEKLNNPAYYPKICTRVKFFQYFATAVNNHIRSLVHKYRFTEKRTGVKPPPKKDRFKPVEPLLGEARVKTVEVRLDDEEIGLQVADKPCQSECEHEYNEIRDDWEGCLDPLDVNPLEVIVYRQLSAPNKEALFYAQMEAMRGHKPGDCLDIKIKPEHLAAGLRDVDGTPLSVEKFEQIVLRVRDKITKHRSMTQTEEQANIRRNAAISQLEQVFNLQIPRTIDPIIVSRLLTICARDQFDKVKDNEQVQQLLEEVGAKVPKAHGGVLSCRGVLFSKNNRICNACGYRGPCATESANFGLGKITIAPKLLGAKNTRIPAILPNDPDHDEAPVPSSDELEIVNYLEENFLKAPNKGKVHYAHREKINGVFKHLFRVTTDGSDFKLHFCNPSEALKTKLRYELKSYFAPPGLSVSEVIALIDMHARETYVVA